MGQENVHRWHKSLHPRCSVPSLPGHWPLPNTTLQLSWNPERDKTSECTASIPSANLQASCTHLEHRTDVFLGEKYEMKKEIKFSATNRSSTLSFLHTHHIQHYCLPIYMCTCSLRCTLDSSRRKWFERAQETAQEQSSRLIWYFLCSKNRISGRRTK